MNMADFFEEIADRLLELRLFAGQKIRACMDGSAEVIGDTRKALYLEGKGGV